jgi:hypothetical protein
VISGSQVSLAPEMEVSSRKEVSAGCWTEQTIMSNEQVSHRLWLHRYGKDSQSCVLVTSLKAESSTGQLRSLGMEMALQCIMILHEDEHVQATTEYFSLANCCDFM